MNKKRTLLLRAIAGDLSEQERQELDRRLASSPALAAELQRLQRLQHLMSEMPSRDFAVGFPDRVMRGISAIRTHPRITLTDALASVFFRLAPASLAAAIVIAAVNIATSTIPDQTPVEAAVGLRPDASLADVYQGMLVPSRPALPEDDNATE